MTHRTDKGANAFRDGIKATFIPTEIMEVSYVQMNS